MAIEDINPLLIFYHLLLRDPMTSHQLVATLRTNVFAGGFNKDEMSAFLAHEMNLLQPGLTVTKRMKAELIERAGDAPRQLGLLLGEIQYQHIMPQAADDTMAHFHAALYAPALFWNGHEFIADPRRSREFYEAAKLAQGSQEASKIFRQHAPGDRDLSQDEWNAFHSFFTRFDHLAPFQYTPSW